MASRSSKVISLSLANAVLVAVNVVSGMVFARVLSVADYGTYLQTFLAYDFALPLLTLGLPSALFYFLPGARERKKGLVLDNILLMLLSGLIFSLFLIFGGTELLAKRFNNPDLSKTLRWMVYYPLYTFPVLIASAVWVTQDKVKLNATYNVITGIILTLFLIAAAFLTNSYEAPTQVRIFIPILFLPVAIYLIFKHVPGSWYKPSLSSMWSMAKFSIPLGLAAAFGTIAIQLAAVIVSSLTTPEEFAIYANGAKEVPFVTVITGSIAVIIMADMSKKCKEGDLKSALELFRKASVLSACFLFPIMIMLMVHADSFIQVLYSSKYELSVVPFRIYLFFLPVRIVYYGSAFIALGRSKAILYRSIISLLLTGILAYLLTLYIGYIGAAIATVIVSYIWAIPYNLISLGKAFKCKPSYIVPFNKLGRIMVISIISGFFSSVILTMSFPPVVSLITGAVVFGTIYILASLKYNSDFSELTAPLINKLNKFK